ncbi:MAG: hypothetical protein PHW76_05055 [Alphaproteobacteria bacterium]|nr:hypothetical protein [Alphaproteobacteria bacterium]
MDGNSLTVKFRRQVLTVREKEDLTIAEVAARFCVGIVSVTRWLETLVPRTTRNKPAIKIPVFLGAPFLPIIVTNPPFGKVER